ncbi:hypothetical protein OAG24_00795 [bacterium]|nr:hypothetical protein [bacterium]
MGVPRLFQWILEKFPNYVEKINMPATSVKKVDCLHIDGNALVHPAAQFIYKYGKYESVIFDEEIDEESFDEKMELTFNLFFNEIIKMTTIVRPQKVLFISLDGPAPLSKQAQQRERRFISATHKSTFDQNHITPGTTFSYELNKFMECAIRKEISSNKYWKDIEVIFSPTSEPGEGEHKLMDYIRASPKAYSHCLVGPDGDLIMLALAAHRPNIFLLRENQFSRGDEIPFFYFLNFKQIRDSLIDVMGQAEFYKSGLRTVDDISNDFILLGFLVGNDFLPKIKMFYMLEQGVELMVEQYKKLTENGTNFLTKSNKINFNSLTLFIGKLSGYELEYLIGQYYQYKERVRKAWDHEKKQELKEMQDHTLFKFLRGKAPNLSLDFDGYRKAYYNKANVKPENKINKMCSDYVKTLVWILDYYISGLKSWTWSYDWHYPPLMIDLFNYLETKSYKELSTFDKGRPSLQFEQLLSVLPPDSSTLLPKPYAKLLTDNSSPLIKKGYCPKKIHIDYEGKFVKYQGVVLLPFVHFEDIVKAYDTVTSQIGRLKFGKVSYIRNKRGVTQHFFYDENKCESYAYVSQLTSIAIEVDSCVKVK